MRLVVFIGVVAETLGVLVTGGRLDVEVMRLLAAGIDEEAREVEIALLAGDAAEADQRQLDFLVAAIAGLMVRAGAEDGADMVGIAAHGVKQRTLAGGLEIGDGSFHQMAGAIEFVAIAQIGPALARAHADEPGIEVAIRLLQLAEHRDDLVGLCLKIGVGRAVERVGRCLDDLGDVGIPEHLDIDGVRRTVGPGVEG